jgi:NAD(P) transhydrogenase subunit alpha
MVKWIGFVGIVLGAINVTGGFLVTDRMLRMFGKKPETPKA